MNTNQQYALKTAHKTEENNLNSLHLDNIHPSWITTLPHGKLVNKLRASPAATELIGEHIRKHLHIQNSGSFQHEESLVKDLSLLTPKDFESLVLKAGTVQLSGRIKQVIKADDIKRIKDALGQDLYTFAVFTASSLYPLSPAFRNNIVKNQNILKTVINCGYHSLIVILENTSSDSILLKLPKVWNEDHMNTYKQYTSEENEQLFHSSLIKNIVGLKHKNENLE